MKKNLHILLFLLAAGSLPAQTWYVSPQGSDWMEGGKETPFRSINYAMSKAKSGDTIRLLPGIYHEHVKFQPRTAITLEGTEKAILDASDYKYKPTWSRAKNMPDGTWETPAKQEFRTVTVDGKWLTMLNYKRVTPQAAAKRKTVRGSNAIQEVDGEMVNIWDFHIIFKRGVGDTGWTGIRRIGMYDPKKQVIYFRDVKNAEPDDLKFTFSRQDQPAIQLHDADNCIIRGLTIRNATTGISVERANHAIIENCTFRLCEFGVRLRQKSNDCKVRCNYFTLPSCSAMDPWERESWDNWKAHKEAGFWDRIAINVEDSGDRHEIHDNEIVEHWGGIQDTFNHAKRPAQVTCNRDLHVHHNRIHIICDDALEPNGSGINGRWHHNMISRSRCGLRLKEMFHGPFFAYNNLFLDNKEDCRNFGCPDLRKAWIFIYQNTSSSPAAVTNNAVPQKIGTPNYYYVNNVFLCERWFKGGAAKPDWHGDFNVFFRRGESPDWNSTKALAKTRGLDQHSRWIEGQSFGKGWNSLLIPDEYRKFGTDPEQFCGRKLPGVDRTKPFYAGALRPGERLPVIPRPRAEAANEP